MHGLAPSYITEMLQPYKPSRSLRSSSKRLLTVPSAKLKKYGCRSFSFVDFQKSPSSDFIWRWTSRDFVARGRPLCGQKGSLSSPRGRLVASLFHLQHLQFGTHCQISYVIMMTFQNLKLL